jgi:preprotein translocase subunit SecG
MQSVLIVIHLLIVLAMVGLILLQRSEGGGLGMGSTGGFMTSRGTSNVLTRATAFLAIGFFTTSLVLSILAGIERKPASVLSNPASPAAPGAPQPPAGGGGGVLDQLRQQSGPQVPSSQ